MKNFGIIAFSTILIASSCAKVEDPRSDDKFIILDQNERTIEATMTIPSLDDFELTKTHVGDDEISVFWDETDQVSFFYNGDNGVPGGDKFKMYKISEDAKKASFKGRLENFFFGDTGENETPYLWGVYPYRETTTCDNESVTIEVPQFQRCYAGTFAQGTHIAVGKSENFRIQLYSINSVVRFQLRSTTANMPDDIYMIEMKSLNGEPLVGDVTIDLQPVENQDRPEVIRKGLANEESSVILKPIGGNGSFELDKTYFLEFLPQTLSGFELTLYTPTKIGTFTFARSNTFRANGSSSITSRLNAAYSAGASQGILWKDR